MFNREARQERREERQQDRSFGHRNSGNTKYKMRERLISIDDDFFIENEDGDRVFRVNGKALRVRQTLAFEDLQGHECYVSKTQWKLKMRTGTRLRR